MSAWRQRLEQLPDARPTLPLRPGPVSNGEFVPPPPTDHDRQVAAAILDRVAAAAHANGMDRRRFLQSSAGVAA